MTYSPNNLFSGRYTIIKEIGKGGMGRVFLAKNLKLGTFWAIKEIRKANSNKLDLLAEPNIMKKLSHPAIVQIFDIDEDPYSIYIVEEFVEGISVEDKLKQLGRIDENLAVEWTKQICDALHYIHNLKPNPIIYRDMKPSNVMITKDNKVKIIDFGIAREYKKHADSDTTYIGTRGYAAPEQYGTSQTDARTDIYSLGITLYHMVTGIGPKDPPYEILPIRQIDSNLSTGLEYIILKCTKLNPEERYQSVSELLHDLNNIERFSFTYRKNILLSRIKLFASMLLILACASLIYGGVIKYKAKKLENYNNTIEAGIQYINEKQYDLALSKFDEALNMMPENIDSYRETARVYLEQGDNDKCISYLEREVLSKVDNTKSNPSLFYLLGTAYFNKKDYKNARINFRQAENLDENEVIYKRDYAVSLARMDDLSNAEKKLEEIKQKDLSEEVSWYVNGEILLAKKDPEEAVSCFTKCIDLTKDEDLKKRAFISTAQTYSSNTTLPNAIDNEIAILERANSELKEKNNLQIIEMIGSAYYRKALVSKENKNEMSLKSIDYFNQLLNMGYNRPYIFKNIAIIYQLIGDFNNAEKTLFKMKELYPEDFTCYQQLSLLYADIESKKPNEKRNYAKTNENYKLAVKYAPKGEETPDLASLNKLIEDLKKYKWIK